MNHTSNFSLHQGQRKKEKLRICFTYHRHFKLHKALLTSHYFYFSFLAEKYGLTKSHLGEQDWFNLLQFECSNMVYVIPCEYNLQLDISYQKQELFKVSPLII